MRFIKATDVNNGVIEHFVYGYRDVGDGAGSHGSLREYVLDHNRNQCIDWEYDLLDRLVEASVRTGADEDCDGTEVDRWDYEYDNASNLVHRERDATGTTNDAETTFRVNSRDQLCWESNDSNPTGGCSSVPTGGTEYDYDDAGNLTNASGRYQLAYDDRNRTTSITPNGSSARTQTYAGEGQSERLTSGGTSFLHDKLGIGWANVTGSGTGDPLPNGQTYYLRAPDGSLVSQRKPDGTKEYFILDGHPGSVVALVNPDLTVATSMVRARYRYDPYGNVTVKSGASDTPYRFAGAWFDRFPGSASVQRGLYKMGERYYDPRNARWATRDPMDHKGDLRQSNRYSYAGSDPVNHTDQSGMFLEDVFDGTFVEDIFGETIVGMVWGCYNPVDTTQLAAGGTGFAYGFSAGYASASDLGGAGATGVGLASGGAGATIGYTWAGYVGCAQTLYSYYGS